jgi:hypothetical protein
VAGSTNLEANASLDHHRELTSTPPEQIVSAARILSLNAFDLTVDVPSYRDPQTRRNLPSLALFWRRVSLVSLKSESRFLLWGRLTGRAFNPLRRNHLETSLEEHLGLM